MTDSLFSKILALSLAGSGTIFVVLFLRLLLRKQSKGITCILWAAVMFRLVSPVAVSWAIPGTADSYSPQALVARVEETVVEDTVILYSHTDEYAQAVEQGREPLIHKASGARYFLAAKDDGAVPDTAGTVWFPVLGRIWLAGAGAAACYHGIGYFRLKRKLRDCLDTDQGYFITDHMAVPFVLGVIRPKIYLPSGLTDRQSRMILLHEQCHIRYLDHWAKLILTGIRCVHWFNPVVWIGCAFASRDLEMRCDEAVLRRLGPEARSDYAQTILNLSVSRQRRYTLVAGFGGGEIRSRIQRVIRWRRSPVWHSAVCLVLCAAAVLLMVSELERPAPAGWIDGLDSRKMQVKAYPAYGELPDPTLTLNEKQMAHLTSLLQTVDEDQICLDPGDPLIHVGSLHLQTGDQAYYLFLGVHRFRGTTHLRMVRHGDPEHAYYLDNLALTEYVEHVFDHFVCSELSPKQLSEELVQVDSFYLDSRTHVYVFQYYCDRCGTYGKKFVESVITSSRLYRWKE